jgi:hypothetical protein
MESSLDEDLPPHVPLLLALIAGNSSLSKLVDEGLTYDQIAELIETTIRRNLVVEYGTELRLTVTGEQIRLKYLSLPGKRGGKDWIRPLEEYRIDKIGIDDVYLPSLATAEDIAESLAPRGKPRE